jgi:hypothetical protein
MKLWSAIHMRSTRLRRFFTGLLYSVNMSCKWACRVHKLSQTYITQQWKTVYLWVSRADYFVWEIVVPFCCLLGCYYLLSSCMRLHVSWRIGTSVSKSRRPGDEGIWLLQKLINICQTILYHIPEDGNHHANHSENLESHAVLCVEEFIEYYFTFIQFEA